MTGVLKAAASEVVVELRGSAVVRLGSAVGLGHPIERAPEILLRLPLYVVGDEQIELAVAIVVEPRGAGAKAGVVDPGGGGDVAEVAAALVVKEGSTVERGDVHIV